MAKAAAKVPAGYADEAEFLAEMRERFTVGQSADKLNRDAALEDLEFLAGKQWDAADIEARKGRPCLTINRLPQFIAQVVGDIRINRPAIRVRPAEDADKELADTREGLIRTIERQSDAQGVYASTGQSQVACGIGNFRVTLDYADDDVFDRDIFIKAIPNPLAVVWDPMSIDPTGRDAKWCFVVDEMPRKDFEAAYKDERPGDLGTDQPQLQAGGWYGKDTVRVTEYWIIKETEVELALLQDGSVIETKDIKPPEQPVKTRKSLRKSACVYLTNGRSILEKPVEFPISRLPIIKVTGWEINVGQRRDRFGLVRFAKDPQRLMNYWRSVSAEMLALAPKASWLLHETQEGNQEAFRQNHKDGENVLSWTGSVKPERVDPPPMPAAVLQEAALASQDLKDTTGLHDASLGAKSNETSGKAIMARQREGDVASYVYHDNLQASIRECGRIVNELIPITYDTARTLRILGEDGDTKLQRVNDPADPEAHDLAQGKYDIVVETGPSYSTKRVEAAESMMAFVQAMPQAASLVGDLIAKAQDWPLAEDIADRLKHALPPQILAGEKGKDGQPIQPPQPPPDPNLAKAAELNMQKLGFETQEAEANAQKALAQAAQEYYAALDLATSHAVGEPAVNALHGVYMKLATPMPDPTMGGAQGQPPAGPPGPPQAAAAPEAVEPQE